MQDDNGCDLDPSYHLFDVFEEKGLVRVIIADDGLGPRQLLSPAANKLARAQTTDRSRRESFDSVMGYNTPSISSLNTSSPVLQARLDRHRYEKPADPRNGLHSSTTLTEDARSKMQVDDNGQSPEIPSPYSSNALKPPVSPKGKRKRPDTVEVPASPEESRHGKKRAKVSKSGDVLETPELQDSNIPESPLKDTKQKASPLKEAQTAKVARKAKNPAVPAQAADDDDKELSPHDQMPKEIPKPVVVVTVTRGRNKQVQAAKESQASQGEQNENVQAPKPSTPDAKAAKGQNKAGKKTALNKTANPLASADSAADTSKGPVKPQSRKAAKPNTIGQEVSGPSTDPDKLGAKSTVKIRRKSTVKKAPKAQSDEESELSSPTSRSESSRNSTDGDSQTSSTSRSQRSSSEMETSSDAESSTRESLNESGSDENMTIDSSDSGGASTQKNPMLKGQSMLPVKKKSTNEASTRAPLKARNPKDENVSRSASPVGSISSSSSSDNSSDLESSKSDGSASDSETVSDDDSAKEGSMSGASDSGSESDSAGSTSSKSSRSSKSSSQSRSVSPVSTRSNVSSNESSVKDGNSSTSSRLVAVSLGGQTSSQKSKPVEPVQHNTSLPQVNNQSPSSESLSQQPPLAALGRSGSKLKKWSGLSDLAKKLKEFPSRNPSVERVVDSESDESESESGSSDDSSSDESDKEDSEIPKAKLAGRAPVAKHKKSGGLRSMFK